MKFKIDEPVNNKKLLNLCGALDINLKEVAKKYDVEITRRGSTFTIIGEDFNSKNAKQILNYLYSHNQDIDLDELSLIIDNYPSSTLENKDLKIKQKKFFIKTKNQKKLCEEIFRSDLIFGIGPAGTGKTFLSIACAVQLYEEKKIERIILTRPAVEAGERLGFLPGDLVQKIDPYLKPLYDSLYYFLSFDKVNKLIEKNIIEIVPLAYMRGRTLENAFIILDEAQNSTKAQMKMFLTRIGKGSKVVITGDPTQTDLPSNTEGGLSNVEVLFNKINGIEFVKFKSQDVVRHRLVKEIIRAYEKNEQ